MTERLLLDELTTWMAESVAIDEALFTMLGEWSIDEPVAMRRVAFAMVSRWLGEHAVTMRGLLPDSPALAATDRVALPADWVERIGQGSSPTDRDVKFGSLARARLDRDDLVRDRIDPAADGPLMCHLAHSRLDLQAWQRVLDQRQHGSDVQGWRG
jgi:hypothetical protein